MNGHQINVEKAEYMKAVNGSMAASFGVGFVKVHNDIDPHLAIMSQALADGVFADDFVDRLSKTYGFVRAEGETSLESARAENLRIAALANYVREDDGWAIGGDGAIYRSGAGGVFKMEAVTSRSGNWGFGAFFSEDAEIALDDDGFATVTGGTFDFLGGGVDIHNAVAHYEARLEMTQGPGLH